MAARRIATVTATATTVLPRAHESREAPQWLNFKFPEGEDAERPSPEAPIRKGERPRTIKDAIIRWLDEQI